MREKVMVDKEGGGVREKVLCWTTCLAIGHVRSGCGRRAVSATSATSGGDQPVTQHGEGTDVEQLV